VLQYSSREAKSLDISIFLVKTTIHKPWKNSPFTRNFVNPEWKRTEKEGFILNIEGIGRHLGNHTAWINTLN